MLVSFNHSIDNDFASTLSITKTKTPITKTTALQKQNCRIYYKTSIDIIIIEPCDKSRLLLVVLSVFFFYLVRSHVNHNCNSQQKKKKRKQDIRCISLHLLCFCFHLNKFLFYLQPIRIPFTKDNVTYTHKHIHAYLYCIHSKLHSYTVQTNENVPKKSTKQSNLYQKHSNALKSSSSFINSRERFGFSFYTFSYYETKHKHIFVCIFLHFIFID